MFGTNGGPRIGQDMIGRSVIVRTYSAGVHFGTLARIERTEVLLTDARRIWQWSGAFTLSAVASKGVGRDSKLSVSVPEILFTEAIEIIPCTEEATANLRALAAHEI